MNQRFDPSDKRNVNPGVFPADQANANVNPATGPVNDQRIPEDMAPRSSRSRWPLLIILLAGVVLALLVWLPAEMSDDTTTDTATPPATEQTTETPAGNTATPSATTPDNSAATPVTPDTQTPATGTGTQTPATGAETPATGTAPAN